VKLLLFPQDEMIPRPKPVPIAPDRIIDSPREMCNIRGAATIMGAAFLLPLTDQSEAASQQAAE